MYDTICCELAGSVIHSRIEVRLSQTCFVSPGIGLGLIAGKIVNITGDVLG